MYSVAVILHRGYYTSKRRECFGEMDVIFFFSALTGHESVLLGVGSLFYIAGHLVILPVLSQSRCFREVGDF